jgi:hypothetical protein
LLYLTKLDVISDVDVPEDSRYLRRRFRQIGRRIGDPQWFSTNDIKALVRVGSGHPAFTKIVHKFVSENPSPPKRLRTLLSWVPPEGTKASPAEALDWLYANILRAAKYAYEAVDTHNGRDFLVLLRIYQLNFSGNLVPLGAIIPLDSLSYLLHLERNAAEILAWDLRCLSLQHNSGIDRDTVHTLDSAPAPVPAKNEHEYVFYKSFVDFWDEDRRAKELFVDFSRICTHLAKCCMHHIAQCSLEINPCASSSLTSCDSDGPKPYLSALLL